MTSKPSTLIPVILSGGAGTRLWPVSRQAHPKPFMRLPDGEVLLQKTARRALALPGITQLLTITNREYYFQTRDEYAEVQGAEAMDLNYLLEPCARNTAPAIASAALWVAEQHGDDALMLVLPADHVIDDQQGFTRSVHTACELAQRDYLVTFGIVPTRAETGYGYIKAGQSVADLTDAYEVERFVEKPDADTAANYLQSGDYLWNGGMFCFKAGVFLETLASLQADMDSAVRACWQLTEKDLQPVELDADSFAAIPPDSIDYAVMEKAAKVAMVKASFAWSDVGSWDAVCDLARGDEAGNRMVGEAMLFDCQETFVHGEGRTVAALGLERIMIVDTSDALLVAHRDKAQEVKRIVDHLKAEQHEAYKLHDTVHRPWGTYTVLESGPRFKIKRIVVKPGAELSLQMHYHRSEHWVVVSGTAKVVNGEQEFLVRTDESTYVPAGNAHRLINPGITDLVMIEVQSGEYLGEDDIVRFDDRYGRSK